MNISALTTLLASANGASQRSSMSMIILIVAMFGVMYFVMIRPQKKKQQQEQEMRDSIQVGDEITTIGGIMGRVVTVKEDSLVIEDELLNGFFDTGYIITNSPAVVSCSASDDLILFNKAMGDAYEGSSDFFVQIKLYYTNSLHTIDWSVASVSTGKTIKESKFESSVKAFDEKGLRSVSSRLISEISKILKSTKA